MVNLLYSDFTTNAGVMNKFCFSDPAFVLFKVSRVHNLIGELMIGDLNDLNRSWLNLKLVRFECIFILP